MADDARAPQPTVEDALAGRVETRRGGGRSRWPRRCVSSGRCTRPSPRRPPPRWTPRCACCRARRTAPGCGLVGLAPEDDLKAVPGEGRRDPGKQVAGVDLEPPRRVGLQRGRTRRGGHADGGLNQGSHHAATTVGAAHEEARNRPHRQIIRWLQLPGARQPGQLGARGQLAPPDRPLAVKGKQARRRPDAASSRRSRLLSARGRSW